MAKRNPAASIMYEKASLITCFTVIVISSSRFLLGLMRMQESCYRSCLIRSYIPVCMKKTPWRDWRRSRADILHILLLLPFWLLLLLSPNLFLLLPLICPPAFLCVAQFWTEKLQWVLVCWKYRSIRVFGLLGLLSFRGYSKWGFLLRQCLMVGRTVGGLLKAPRLDQS